MSISDEGVKSPETSGDECADFSGRYPTCAAFGLTESSAEELARWLITQQPSTTQDVDVEGR